MTNLRNTKTFWRSRLPHWEVENSEYFITIRCTGSLPIEAQRRLEELKQTTEQQSSKSEAHANYQREIFSTCEKYLDQGLGFCPFESPNASLPFIEGLETWADEANWLVLSYCIMPNHIHLLANPKDEHSLNLETFIKRLKGRTARNINKILGRGGPFWQTEWFDRWIRNDAERARTIAYIQNNPVKARLVNKPEDYPFSK
ncbi:MAG: transposase [Opitutaceae bacterium]|nr:transposase [Opitutaceae bacterium]